MSGTVFTFPPSPATGDRVTNPNNNAVYLWDGNKWVAIPSGARISFTPTAPSDATLGDFWWDATGAQLYLYDGDWWIVVVNQPGGGGGQVTIDVNAPADPRAGNLWWDLTDAKLYLWTGAEWVIVVNTPGGGMAGARVEIGLSPPATPAAGNLWWDPQGAQLYLFDGAQWVVTVNQTAGGGGGGASVEVGTSPPSDPEPGHLWWDPNVGQLFVFDGDRWVISVNQPGGGGGGGGIGDAPLTTTPFVRQAGAWEPLTIEVMPGVTDGSDPAPGFVGEIITSGNNTTVTNDFRTWVYAPATFGWLTVGSMLVPAGDWEVSAAIDNVPVADTNATDHLPPGVLDAAADNVAVCLSPSTVVDPDNDFTYWPNGWNQNANDYRARLTLMVGPVRVSSASPVTMLLRMRRLVYNSRNAFSFHGRRVR